MRQVWATVVALAVGCSGDDPATGNTTDTGSTDVDLEALVEELAAPGDYRVGYRKVPVSWSDALLTGGEVRELQVSVWYPTEDTSGDDVSYQDAFPADEVLGGAALAGDDLPVAVFSHGHQAYGEAASFLMEHLATHGWVVVAPDHLGNLVWDGDARDTEIYLQRPLDLVAVLDWLDDPAGDELGGRLAPGRLGMGHSFGGYTLHAVAGASFDPAVVAACDDGSPFCSTMTPELAERFADGVAEQRFTALVAMDPGDHRLFGEGLGDVVAPELYMSADFDDEERVDSLPFWTDLDHPDDVWASFPGLAHNGFTDVAGALDPPGVQPPEEGWYLVRASVLAWGRGTLLSDAGSKALFEEDSPLAGESLDLRYR